MGGPLACNHQPVNAPAKKQAHMVAIGGDRRVVVLFTASLTAHYRNTTGVPGFTSEASRAASQFVSRTQP
jgi:hypothetical protein